MITIAQPADLFNPAAVATPADDFDVRTDAEWEAMYEASAAMDAVCSGNPIF
jgi:hypothetical protein